MPAEQRFDIAASLKQTGTKKKVFNGRPIKNDNSLEAEYYSDLRKMMQTTKDFYLSTVVEGINKDYIKEQIFDESPYSQLNSLLSNVKRRILSRYDMERIKELATRYVIKLNYAHRAKFNNSIKASIGIDISKVPEFEHMKPFIASAVKQNVSQIVSLRNENLARLETTLRNSVHKGLSIANVQESILQSYNVSKKKAAGIARNEIKNLQSQLQKKRMQNLGMDLYTWETAGDERVRGRPGGKYPNAKPDHWEMQGLICKFSDPTVYSKDGGKTWKRRLASMPQDAPGEDINCRCIARPYIYLGD